MGLHPRPAGRNGRHIDRQCRNKYWRKDNSAQGAVLACMQAETCAPSKQQNRNAPAAQTGNHYDKRSNRRTRTPKPVLHRRICRHQPVRVLRGIAPHNRRSDQSQTHQAQADQFFAALLQHRVHLGVEKWIALGLNCHAFASSHFLCAVDGVTDRL